MHSVYILKGSLVVVPATYPCVNLAGDQGFQSTCKLFPIKLNPSLLEGILCTRACLVKWCPLFSKIFHVLSSRICPSNAMRWLWNHMRRCRRDRPSVLWWQCGIHMPTESEQSNPRNRLLRSRTRKLQAKVTAACDVGLSPAVDQLERDGCAQTDVVDVYKELLQRCGNSRDLSQGKRLHFLIDRSKHAGDRYVKNLLVEMYGKCGSLEDAKAVFATIGQRNVFSWGILIAAFAQNGHYRDALGLFWQMGREGVLPNEATFVAAVGACSNLGALEEGRKIHSAVVLSELESRTTVCNSLINMYGKCGSLEEAKRVFHKMPCRSVVSWTSLIVGYTQQGHSRKALELYEKMVPEGVKPNEITFVSVLGACSDLRDLVQARTIHRDVIAAGFESGIRVANALISLYGKCSSLREARGVFDRMCVRDVVSWNAMISAYAQHGHGNGALELYHRMDPEGVKPNEITYVSLLDACVSVQALTQGKQIYERIVHAGFDSDIIIMTTAISMYSKCGSLDDARRVFDKLQCRNVAFWNAMIGAYAQHGYCKEALELYSRMDLEPNDITFISALGACSSLRSLAEGKAVHARILGSRFSSEVVVGNALINMYYKCGSLDDARTVFDGLAHRDLVSWTAILAAYAEYGHGLEAIRLYQRMLAEGLTPDDITFVSVLDACSSDITLSQGRAIHAQVVATGLESHIAVGTALVDMYGKCGSLHDAREVFDRMPCKRIFPWTVMIAAYARHGHSKEAVEVFQQMCLDGVELDDIAFVGILSACSHAGLIKEGRQFFLSMNGDYNIVPLEYHYGCIIDLFGRMGWLVEAEDLLESMPFQPSVVLWTSFLGACRVQRDAKRGEKAAKVVAELDPGNTAPYMLLSYTYAYVGRWDDVSKVRKMMDDRGLKKDPGCSFI